jgi:hypothetical protein
MSVALALLVRASGTYFREQRVVTSALYTVNGLDAGLHLPYATVPLNQDCSLMIEFL